MFKKRHHKKGEADEAAAPATDAEGGPMLDPIVPKVQEHYEETVNYFMTNISNLVEKYNKRLEVVLPKNPLKIDEETLMEPHTPLWKKRSELAKEGSTTNPPAAPAPTAATAASTPAAAVIAALPANGELLRELRVLKYEANELSNVFDAIHDWVALNVPDMREDEDAGVQIQASVLEQTEELTSVLRTICLLELKYLTDRAELETQLIKYPGAVSLVGAVKASDDNTWDEIERSYRTMIRICILLYSLFQKNMKKLKQPREEPKVNMWT